jgi:4-amino-4-deoxy-L-arabinose transferase-like glycosyltransferase
MQQNVDLPHLATRGVSATIYMEKIVISPAEVAETQSSAEQPARLEPKLAPAIPRWAKWILAPLVLVLPLLCLVTIVLRVAMRGLPPRTRHEWTSLLATLLIVGGIGTSVATVLVSSFAPRPPVAGVGLSELDEQTFPSLPARPPCQPETYRRS